MKKQLIHTENLCKTYSSDGVQTHVLTNVNLEVLEGDFTVLMGPSGSGKSTMLYALSALDDVTGGKVFFDGKQISNQKKDSLLNFRRKEIGFVYQQPNLISDMSIYENIALPAMLLNEIKKSEIHTQVDQVASQLEIKHILNKNMNQISGGEAQRASIARAVINKPKLVFADEPTGALNSNASKNVLDMLTKLHEASHSMFVVTHDLKTAIRGNRILYLSNGDIVGEVDLGMYQESNEVAREEQLKSWLTSLGW